MNTKLIMSALVVVFVFTSVSFCGLDVSTSDDSDESTESNDTESNGTNGTRAIIYNTQSGAWTSTATWGFFYGIPGVGDLAVIRYDVTAAGCSVVGDIKVEDTGSLVITNTAPAGEDSYFTADNIYIWGLMDCDAFILTFDYGIVHDGGILRTSPENTTVHGPPVGGYLFKVNDTGTIDLQGGKIGFDHNGATKIYAGDHTFGTVYTGGGDDTNITWEGSGIITNLGVLNGVFNISEYLIIQTGAALLFGTTLTINDEATVYALVMGAGSLLDVRGSLVIYGIVAYLTAIIRINGGDFTVRTGLNGGRYDFDDANSYDLEGIIVDCYNIGDDYILALDATDGDGNLPYGMWIFDEDDIPDTTTTDNATDSDGNDTADGGAGSDGDSDGGGGVVTSTESIEWFNNPWTWVIIITIIAVVGAVYIYIKRR